MTQPWSQLVPFAAVDPASELTPDLRESALPEILEVDKEYVEPILAIWAFSCRIFGNKVKKLLVKSSQMRVNGHGR